MATNLMPVDPEETRSLQVKEDLDCALAQQLARRVAQAAGFSATATEEIVLVAAELASNMVKHAGHGTLTLRTLHANGGVGIEIKADDHGPGIVDVEQSMADGYSTTDSLGYGLGTVNRLMDEVDIASTLGLGTRVLCRRWQQPASPPRPPRGWDVGVATRSRGFAPHNGDAFVVHESDGKLLAGVIDGLGHGEGAQQAALAALRYVQSHAHLPLEKIFQGTSRACRATRGVVMALARFESLNELAFASVGNIEARAWAEKERIQLLPQRGIVGLNDPTVVVQRTKWKPGWLLVLHSDGLHARWQWTDFPGIEREPAQSAAQKLMRYLGGEEDDATVLLTRMPAA